MTDENFSARDYKITFETFNGFFGAWLKRNLFIRHRFTVTLTFTAVLMIIVAVTGRQMLGLMINEPNMLLWIKILELSLLFVLEAMLSFVIVAIPVYILSPIVSYIWLAISFMIGPVRKRANTANVSVEGITKSYATYSHTTPWSAVYDLVETRKSLLIFTNRNCAMMIPKRAFETPEAAQAFFAAASTYWHRAKA